MYIELLFSFSPDSLDSGSSAVSGVPFPLRLAKRYLLRKTQPAGESRAKLHFEQCTLMEMSDIGCSKLHIGPTHDKEG
jgi:hypothetical protein